MGARTSSRKSALVFSSRARAMCDRDHAPHGLHACPNCEGVTCDGRCEPPTAKVTFTEERTGREWVFTPEADINPSRMVHLICATCHPDGRQALCGADLVGNNEEGEPLDCHVCASLEFDCPECEA